MLSFRERLLSDGPASRAGARCAAWRDPDESTLSLFRFGVEDRKESGPAGVRYRLPHPRRGLLGHLLDGEILDRDECILRDNSMSQLMMEVLALILSLSVETGNGLPCLMAPCRPTFLAAQRPLRDFETLFRLPIPPWILDLLASGKCCEGFQADVDADLSLGEGISASRHVVAREDGVPLSSLAFDAASLRGPLDLAMQLDLHLSKLGEVKPLSVNTERQVLRKREAIIAITRFEAWIARSLSAFNATEERLESKVNTVQDVLQGLRVDRFDVWPKPLDLRKLSALNLKADRDESLPRFAPLFDRSVIELTANVKPAREDALLGFRRIDPIFEGASHHHEYNIAYVRIGLGGASSAGTKVPAAFAPSFL